MRILESALYAENLAETADFYEGVLGLERFVEAPGRHVFFRVDGGMLLLFKPSATRRPPRGTRIPAPPHGADGDGHLCFAATAREIENWADRLARSGVVVEADFVWPGGGRSIYFRDPAGNSLEFAEPRIWGFA